MSTTSSVITKKEKRKSKTTKQNTKYFRKSAFCVWWYCFHACLDMHETFCCLGQLNMFERNYAWTLESKLNVVMERKTTWIKIRQTKYNPKDVQCEWKQKITYDFEYFTELSIFRWWMMSSWKLQLWLVHELKKDNLFSQTSWSSTCIGNTHNLMTKQNLVQSIHLIITLYLIHLSWEQSEIYCFSYIIKISNFSFVSLHYLWSWIILDLEWKFLANHENQFVLL